MKSIELVREFHAAFGQSDADEPTVNDNAKNGLRLSLLQEELNELNIALNSHDPVATLDALTDLQYVLDGAYLQLGFAPVKDAALAEVHRSNMSKLGADGKPIYRADGKILKGPNYSPPDLATVIRRRSLVVEFKRAQHDHWESLVQDDVCTGCGTNAFDDDSAETGEFAPVPHQNAESSSLSAAPLSVPPASIADGGAALSLEVGGERVLVAPFCEDCNAPVDLGHHPECQWVVVVPGKEVA